jgi:pilus assembly protein CpaB
LDTCKSSDIIGWVTLVNVREGNYMLREMVDQNAGLGPSERAVSIAVNQVTSVGGNVRPGNRVDVIVSYEDEEGYGVTEMLLQDVEVLAVSSLLPPVEEGGLGPSRFLPTGELMSDATVTFALDPQQAMQLTYMSNFAKEVRLMIRRLDERETPPLEPVTPRTFR